MTLESVKDLSERIVADWNLGIADPTNPEWEDLIFALLLIVQFVMVLFQRRLKNWLRKR